MTRAEVQALAVLSARADRLQKCIDETDSLIRSWSRRKGEDKSETVIVSIYCRTDHRSRTAQTTMPIDFVFSELVPVLKRIREEAAARLAALGPPALGEGKT